MSTTAEQIAALRAGITLPTSVTEPETPQPSQEDKLLLSIFDLGLFDAIVPAPEGERLYEYEERRKQFNLIMHDFITEQLNAQQELHDEEVQDLNIKLSNVESLLDKEVIRAADLQSELDRLHSDHMDLLATYEKSKEEKRYEAPSESIKSRISSLKQMSADDLIARMEARHAAKGGAQTVDATFPTETSVSQPGSYPVLTTVEVPEVTFPFPTGPDEVPSEPSDGEVVPEAIRNFVVETIQAFAVKNGLTV